MDRKERVTGKVSMSSYKGFFEKLTQIEQNNEGFRSSILMNQGVYIDLVVDAVVQNLIVGGILAFLILLFFLVIGLNMLDVEIRHIQFH